MSYHYQDNGRGGPPPWPQMRNERLPNLSGGGLLAVAATILGMAAAFVVFVFAVGVAWGSYKSELSGLTTQVAEIKADVKELKGIVPEIRASLAAFKDQPRWTMHVDKR